MKTIIYNELTPQLYKEWLSLWKKSSYANYANSPQWFKAAIETFNYSSYTIVTVYDDATLVGIAPLVKEKIYGITLYTVPPLEYIYDVPFLADWSNQRLTTLLLKSLTSLGPIFLTNIPESFIEILKKKKFPNKIIKQAINYYLPLVIESSGRAEIRNRKKLLHNARHIMEEISLSSEDESKNLDVAFSIDSQSRKQSRGYNVFSTKETKNFYELLVKYFKNHIIINILYYEKTPIAYEIGFIVKRTYYGNQIAFVDEYRKYSPGKVLVLKLLDSLASKGIKKIDFGSGDSSVKRMLTSESQQLYQVILSNNAFLNRFVIGMFQTRNYAFDQLNKHENLYKIYRKIKNSIAL